MSSVPGREPDERFEAERTNENVVGRDSMIKKKPILFCFRFCYLQLKRVRNLNFCYAYEFGREINTRVVFDPPCARRIVLCIPFARLFVLWSRPVRTDRTRGFADIFIVRTAEGQAGESSTWQMGPERTKQINIVYGPGRSGTDASGDRVRNDCDWGGGGKERK